MVSPSYVEKSKCAREKHHMDDDNEDLKSLERELDKWNHSLELGHAMLTVINTVLLVYLISKLT